VEIPEREREGVDEFLFKDMTYLTDEEMKTFLCLMNPEVLAMAICREDNEVQDAFLKVLWEEDKAKVKRYLETETYTGKEITWARACVMKRALDRFCLGKFPWRKEKGEKESGELLPRRYWREDGWDIPGEGVTRGEEEGGIA